MTFLVRQNYLLKPLRTLEEIRADILAVQKEAEALLEPILGASTCATIPGFVRPCRRRKRVIWALPYRGRASPCFLPSGG